MYVGCNMGVGEILSYATGLKRSHFVQYYFICKHFEIDSEFQCLVYIFYRWIKLRYFFQRVGGLEFK